MMASDSSICLPVLGSTRNGNWPLPLIAFACMNTMLYLSACPTHAATACPCNLLDLCSGQNVRHALTNSQGNLMVSSYLRSEVGAILGAWVEQDIQIQEAASLSHLHANADNIDL